MTRLSDTARLAARIARQSDLHITAKQLERIAKEDEMKQAEIPFGLLGGAMVGITVGASIALVGQAVNYAGWQLTLAAFTVTGALWGGASAWTAGRK